MSPMAMGQDLPLRDIHTPPIPDLWPPAPGWWVLLGLGLMLLGLLAWRLYRRYRVLRRRRRILDELAALKAQDPGPELVAEVSALLKRVALSRFPRTEVAALTGREWLGFLDRTGGAGRFTDLQTPLTFDRETARTLLFESAVGLAGRETAIGDAIGLAVKRLREQAAESRILILLTDGANTAGSIDPMKAAELAAIEGVRIYTIGVGAESRGSFGLAIGGARIDEGTLQTIAQSTGGRYFRARDVEGLQAIYGMLDELEPVVSDEKTFRPVDELFQWPSAAALLVSAVLGLAGTGLGPRAGLARVGRALARQRGEVGLKSDLQSGLQPDGQSGLAPHSTFSRMLRESPANRVRGQREVEANP